MTIELKLDTKALETLFSTDEAKVKLQQAVIENFAMRHIKSVVSGISSDPGIKKAISEATETATNQFFTREKKSDSFYGPTTFKYTPKPEVIESFTAGLEDHLSEVAKKELERILPDLDRQIKYKVERAVDRAITNYTTAEVQKQIDEKINLWKQSIA